VIPLRLVGLDLSNAATAIAATHDPNDTPFLSVYTVPGTAKRPLHDQIHVIGHHIRRACGAPSGNRPAGMRPDLVVIEGTFSRTGGHNSDYGLHALHSDVRQWLWRKEIPYAVVSPGTLKVWATGSGSSRGASKVTKRDVVAAVIATYGTHLLINPADDNQTDAVALLTLGLAAYGQPLAEVSAQHGRAIKSQPWPTLAVNPEGAPA
jgi:crossover junction endodeoxyribonuclease RuvC